MDINQSINQ